jgi:hypothetical protein
MAAFRMPEPRRIPSWEARRLLANRVLGWAEAIGADMTVSDRVYLAAKLIADTAAVDLLGWRIFAGGGFADRVSALDATRPAERDLKRITAWTSWRVMPTWEKTPLGVSVAEAAVSAHLVTEVREASRGAIRFVTGSESVRRFFSFPEPRGRSWARAWKRWIRLPGSSLRRMKISRLRGTPRLLLWEAAIEWLVGDPARADGLLRQLDGGQCAEAQTIESRLTEMAKTMDREAID